MPNLAPTEEMCPGLASSSGQQVAGSSTVSGSTGELFLSPIRRGSVSEAMTCHLNCCPLSPRIPGQDPASFPFYCKGHLGRISQTTHHHADPPRLPLSLRPQPRPSRLRGPAPPPRLRPRPPCPSAQAPPLRPSAQAPPACSSGPASHGEPGPVPGGRHRGRQAPGEKADLGRGPRTSEADLSGAGGGSVGGCPRQGGGTGQGWRGPSLLEGSIRATRVEAGGMCPSPQASRRVVPSPKEGQEGL